MSFIRGMIGSHRAEITAHANRTRRIRASKDMNLLAEELAPIMDPEGLRASRVHNYQTTVRDVRPANLLQEDRDSNYGVIDLDRLDRNLLAFAEAVEAGEDLEQLGEVFDPISLAVMAASGAVLTGIGLFKAGSRLIHYSKTTGYIRDETPKSARRRHAATMNKLNAVRNLISRDTVPAALDTAYDKLSDDLEDIEDALALAKRKAEEKTDKLYAVQRHMSTAKKHMAMSKDELKVELEKVTGMPPTSGAQKVHLIRELELSGVFKTRPKMLKMFKLQFRVPALIRVKKALKARLSKAKRERVKVGESVIEVVSNAPTEKLRNAQIKAERERISTEIMNRIEPLFRSLHKFQKRWMPSNAKWGLKTVKLKNKDFDSDQPEHYATNPKFRMVLTKEKGPIVAYEAFLEIADGLQAVLEDTLDKVDAVGAEAIGSTLQSLALYREQMEDSWRQNLWNWYGLGRIPNFVRKKLRSHFGKDIPLNRRQRKELDDMQAKAGAAWAKKAGQETPEADAEAQAAEAEAERETLDLDPEIRRMFNDLNA